MAAISLIITINPTTQVPTMKFPTKAKYDRKINPALYKYRTELHAHTSPASGCSEITPRQMIEVYSKLNYDSIVISNHFYPGMRFEETKEACIAAYLKDYEDSVTVAKDYGIQVIFGCELRTKPDSDHLLFGIAPSILELCYDYLYKPMEEFSEAFRNDTALLIQAHPFRDNMKLMEPKYLDGVEAFNMHLGHNSRNGKAATYAKKHHLIMTAGTDYHHPGHEGLSALRTKTLMKDSFDIARVLRSGDYLLEVGSCIVIP